MDYLPLIKNQLHWAVSALLRETLVNKATVIAQRLTSHASSIMYGLSTQKHFFLFVWNIFLFLSCITLYTYVLYSGGFAAKWISECVLCHASNKTVR